MTGFDDPDSPNLSNTQPAPKRGMRAAIDAMCKQCLYDPEVKGLGHWREQIEACTAPGCPLYPYRPRSYKETPGINDTESPNVDEEVPTHRVGEDDASESDSEAILL